MAEPEGLSAVNKEISDWEIDAYNERPPSREDADRYFNQVLFYNRSFVHFLSDFYDLKDKRILDYGCGAGMFCELFSNYSKDVSGCDISKKQLSSAKDKTNPDISYFKDDFFDSHLEGDCYDFIFCRNLGPLQKINYSKDNAKYVSKIISSLRDDGVGYFILMGNLSGIPGHRLTGFQNHRVGTIYDFFSLSCYVSMINVFGYQAIVVARSEEVAARYNEKMCMAIENMLGSLREDDEVGYLKCKVWLFMNRGVEVNREDFVHVDRYVDRYFSPFLIKGLCYQKSVRYLSDSVGLSNSPLYFISGDQDKFYEKHYERALYETIKTVDPSIRIYIALRQKIVGLLPKVLQRKIYEILKAK